MLLKKPCIRVACLCAIMTFGTTTMASTSNLDTSKSTTKTAMIKAGTPMFARLDSTVNSDSPNHLVTATIIDGKYTGAKLIGKLTKSRLQDGQSTLTTLHFTSMRLNGKWIKPKNVDAYGIDFDEARIAIITEAEYSELKHKVTGLSASLLQSYSNANRIKLGTGTDLGILFMSNVS